MIYILLIVIIVLLIKLVYFPKNIEKQKQKETKKAVDDWNKLFSGPANGNEELIKKRSEALRILEEEE